MAVEVRNFAAIIPAGTAVATPTTVALTMPARTVERIEWRVPPGPRGQVGWFLAMGGTQVVPYGTANYVIADDEDGTWDLTGLPDEGEWELVGYNTGNYPHTVYFRFLVSPVSAAPATTSGLLIPSSALSG